MHQPKNKHHLIVLIAPLAKPRNQMIVLRVF